MGYLLNKKYKAYDVLIKDEINEALSKILSYFIIFCSIGLLSDLYFYIREGKNFIAGLNIVAIIFTFIICFMFFKKILDANKSVIAIVLVTVINLYLSIIGEVYYFNEYSREHILIALSLSLIPILVSGITTLRFLPLTISICFWGLYIFSAIYLKDKSLKSDIPIITILFTGSVLIFSKVLTTVKEIENKTIKITMEREMLIRFLDLEPEQWEMIKEGKMSKEQSVTFLDNLEKNTHKKLIFQLKDFVNTEHEVKEAVRNIHPDLTSSEYDLCCLIVEGLSINEISRIRGVGNSTITSTRSRMRRKMKLDKNENLKDYISKIVYNNRSGN